MALERSPLAEKALLGFNPVNDRIITARFKTAVSCMTIYQVYALTMNADDDEMSNFYDKLQETISNVPTKDMIIMMGDFNAKVGKSDHSSNEVVGGYGIGQRNERGDRLVAFCALNELVISNTQFKQPKENRCWTWQSPNGRDKNQIDYIMISKKWRGSLRNSRAYPSADIGSDHQLVLANLKLKLKRNSKKTTMNRADIRRLKDVEVKYRYQEEIEKRWKTVLTTKQGDAKSNINEEWEQIRDIMHETADEVLGRMKAGKRAEWISLQTLKLADERRSWKPKRRESKESSKHYNYLCRQVKMI